MMIKEWEIIKDFSHLTVSAKLKLINGYLTSSTIQPDIMDLIKSVLLMDSRRNEWIDENDQVRGPNFKYHDGILRFQGRMLVLKDQSLQQAILGEAYRAKYTIHPGVTKMYKDLKEIYWWPIMKKDVVRYVEQYDTC